MNIIKPQRHANKIIDRVWVGDYISSLDKNFIISNNINVIINASKDLPFINDKYNNLIKIRIPVNDDLQKDSIINMFHFYKKIIPIIDFFIKKNKNILIHCYAGVQRSASLLAAYLLYKGYNLPDAINLIQQKRNITFTPQINFYPSLINYQSLIKVR